MVIKAESSRYGKPGDGREIGAGALRGSFPGCIPIAGDGFGDGDVSANSKIVCIHISSPMLGDVPAFVGPTRLRAAQRAAAPRFDAIVKHQRGEVRFGEK